MSSGEQEALRLASIYEERLRIRSVLNGGAEDRMHRHLADTAAELRRLHKEVTEWSERACDLQHELNIALRERDQARFDLATSVRATTEHGQAIVADREAMRMALEALKTELSHGPLIKECHDAIKALEQRVGES